VRSFAAEEKLLIGVGAALVSALLLVAWFERREPALLGAGVVGLSGSFWLSWTNRSAFAWSKVHIGVWHLALALSTASAIGGVVGFLTGTSRHGAVDRTTAGRVGIGGLLGLLCLVAVAAAYKRARGTTDKARRPTSGCT
jgi:hypothetical protein